MLALSATGDWGIVREKRTKAKASGGFQDEREGVFERKRVDECSSAVFSVYAVSKVQYAASKIIHQAIPRAIQNGILKLGQRFKFAAVPVQQFGIAIAKMHEIIRHELFS
jgi:hypothetical protein